jgi:hypothetical protein
MTWKICAFKAEIHFTLQQFSAALLDESALLVSRAATFAGGYSETFGVHVVFERLVTRAEGAVHSAWRHQLGAAHFIINRRLYHSRPHLHSRIIAEKELGSAGSLVENQFTLGALPQAHADCLLANLHRWFIQLQSLTVASGAKGTQVHPHSKLGAFLFLKLWELKLWKQPRNLL